MDAGAFILRLKHYDVVVVGGGPAGAACAARLGQAGARVAVLDRARFPRTKLCAGWITPAVVDELALDIDTYPHRFNTFDATVVHLKGFTFNLGTPQHSIRRYEFDAFLLERGGARVYTHDVKRIRARDDGTYVIDERFACAYVVGAGGTRCPVYRAFFREANPRARALRIVTYEQEFPYAWADPGCHLWFFDRGLPGYAWYVPKADGYVNCGIGATAEKLKSRGENIKRHWRGFTERLDAGALVTGVEYAPKGYSYYLRGNVDVVRIGNAFITGDAAGLATRDLAEGIGPAVRSGHLAAAAIAGECEYSLHALDAFSIEYALTRKALQYLFVG